MKSFPKVSLIRNLVLVILISCTSILPNEILAQNKSTSDMIPTDERLIQGKLDNGMTYFIQKNSKPEDKAELRLAVNAGSILEDDDQQGLAHFVEHMAFNGTENFKKSELVDYLESVGTRFGPDLNAYTSFDETVYMLKVRTDDQELFDKGMLIIKDWASGVTFDHEEIDKERGVVESEWRTRLSADQRMQKEYYPIMYQGSHYAKRLPIGDVDIVRNADYDAFKRFYRDWYRPDLMAVIAVGDFDVAEVEKKIKELFGKIPAAEKPRQRKSFDVPMHDETLVCVTSDAEAAFTNVRIMYKHDRIETKTLQDYRSAVVRRLYNDMLSARLKEISKQGDPPFTFANTSYGRNIGTLDTYSSFAFVPDGKAFAALESLLTENKRVLAHGFTKGELERAKSRVMESVEKSFKEMDKTESRRVINKYVYKYLKGNSTPSPKQKLDLYNTYLPSIELSEINALPAKWIKDDSRVVVITGPEKEGSSLPTKEEVVKALASIDKMEIEPYVDEVMTTPFFDEKLSSAEIKNTKTYDEVDLKYFELANGVEVYLKKTDFKNDEILMRANSPGGSSLYGDDVYNDASSAASIIRESGLGEFSPTQIDKMMSGKTVSVRPFISELGEGLSGSASPDDLEIMFQMIYKYFNNPREDKEAFTSYITKQKGIYANLMSDPRYYFSNYVSKYAYDNHPRVGFPKEEDWAKIKYENALKIYKERFADASDFTFYFTGNFDEAQISKYIQEYLGSLPSINREEKWKDVGRNYIKGVNKDRFKKGVAPKTNVDITFHGDYEYNKDNNYLLSSVIAYLRIKLRETMREDMGGVYGVRLSENVDKKPRERYDITLSFNADPPKTDELVAAANEVIKKAMEEKPSEEDMTKVKETQRQNRKKNLEENRFWQSFISSEHDGEKAFGDILQEPYEKKINALTADQIQAAIKKYFNYDNYIEVIMEPEEK